ncbi:tRNA adenosine deaminase-associated protein [Mycolicibacillus parakoreensis]|uniref:tRNA adenosine deaminase-associated protein n=1 Tax=Mycolicibacillus parakoreensis TaxID=1069221 RepID=A0ABY3U2Y5_9MYCO|nr:tRNA adenosine deaminase-associated protein [Mycolicibacillus parakoreensis]MCV7314618.1 tRNA adenosine deaminase-associated protein [Mycolicibacillus parakoreensis]ULN53061.1 tRNA adenosine deaminase-associated protein [Mycolicibacillus parakoreensis]HLS00175.1 tRNA adenosine deaminase-associated protein [Mycolicibacillus parakoreensis]
MGAAQAATPDGRPGFGVAVVREDGTWRCQVLRRGVLANLGEAETELRELRSTGAVFGLLNVDDEFFVVVRPAPAGARLLLSDATAALEYDLAAEVLDTLDADLDEEDLDDTDPFAEGDLEVLADLGLSAAVLGVIVADPELYADEQVSRIAAEMGFEAPLAAALRR